MGVAFSRVVARPQTRQGLAGGAAWCGRCSLDRVRQRLPVSPQTPRLACWEAGDGPSTAALRLQWKPQLETPIFLAGGGTPGDVSADVGKRSSSFRNLFWGQAAALAVRSQRASRGRRQAARWTECGSRLSGGSHPPRPLPAWPGVPGVGTQPHTAGGEASRVR